MPANTTRVSLSVLLALSLLSRRCEEFPFSPRTLKHVKDVRKCSVVASKAHWMRGWRIGFWVRLAIFIFVTSGAACRVE